MNPRQVRVADRLRELISEGAHLRAKEITKISQRGSPHSFIPDVGELKTWTLKGINILNTAFGQGSDHYRYLVALGNPGSARDVDLFNGVLKAALSDLEGGYLSRQEFLLAGNIFDSVLEQAGALLEAGYKDAAAMLGRVVLEDSLRRLARRDSIQDADRAKASALNDALKAKQVYNQPQWRSIQVMLDIGNSAAHGKFDEYAADQVARMLEDLSRFLAGHLG